MAGKTWGPWKVEAQHGGPIRAPAIAAANLPSPRTKVIVPVKSIAGVPLGESYTQALSAWGITKGRGPGNGCSPNGGDTAVGIEVHFLNVRYKADWTKTPFDG